MWRSERIVSATRGTLKGSGFEANAVVIDSRKIPKGALYVALKGDRVDGHDYVKEALQNGAVAALVHRVPEGLRADASLIVVEDTYKALVDMAVNARGLTRASIIAVTGSVGKTGAKEAIRTAATSAGKVYATFGNLNNHIGLPLSLANLPEDAAFGVFELGMNHAGEISFLSRIVRPDIAVITNVEAVHLEFFSHIEGIAEAKAEILDGMTKDGIIILNRDNRFYEKLAEKARTHGIGQIIGFGSHEEAEVKLVGYSLSELGSQVEAVIYGTPITYSLGAVGRHWAQTSLAALAAVTAAGGDLANAAASLAHFHEPEGRGRLHRVAQGSGYITLIDDAYNASPSSMIAAFSKLAEVHSGASQKGRKIAVLGDMLELGIASVDLHKDLRAPLESAEVDSVFASGPLMQHLYESLPASMQGGYAKNSSLLAPLVQAALQPDDVVLIKGSHGSRMETVREALMQTLRVHSKESADAL